MSQIRYVREEESIRSCVQAVLDQAGRIDSLVNNAGCTLMGALEETNIEEARAIFETNFFGVLRMCQAVLPIMRKEGGGRIINISSVLGFLPGPYQELTLPANMLLRATPNPSIMK